MEIWMVLDGNPFQTRSTLDGKKKSLAENTFKTRSGFWRLDGNLDEICLKHCLKPVPFWMEKLHGWKVGW